MGAGVERESMEEVPANYGARAVGLDNTVVAAIWVIIEVERARVVRAYALEGREGKVSNGPVGRGSATRGMIEGWWSVLTRSKDMGGRKPSMGEQAAVPGVRRRGGQM